MYYGVDENGNIIFSQSNVVLHSEDQQNYPDDFSELPPQIGEVVENDPEDSFSTGSGNMVTGSGNTIIVSPSVVTMPFDYDELIEALSDIPGYTVYPSTQAIDTLTDVLNGFTGKFGYVLLSGSSTQDTHLYISYDYDVNGSDITLFSPVIHCRYYQYRPSSSSSYLYTYTVNEVSDVSFHLTNQLVYTNLVNGYPDILPYKSRASFDLLFVSAYSLILLAVASFSVIFSNRKKGGKKDD